MFVLLLIFILLASSWNAEIFRHVDERYKSIPTVENSSIDLLLIL